MITSVLIRQLFVSVQFGIFPGGQQTSHPPLSMRHLSTNYETMLERKVKKDFSTVMSISAAWLLWWGKKAQRKSKVESEENDVSFP